MRLTGECGENPRAGERGEPARAATGPTTWWWTAGTVRSEAVRHRQHGVAHTRPAAPLANPRKPFEGSSRDAHRNGQSRGRGWKQHPQPTQEGDPSGALAGWHAGVKRACDTVGSDMFAEQKTQSFKNTERPSTGSPRAACLDAGGLRALSL